METYIVRQPIMDSKQKVAAYEILYQQDETSLYNQKDSTVANAIEQFLLQFDNDRILGGKQAFITFTPNLLMKNVPRIFTPDKLVIQIEDNAIIHPLAQKIVQRYKKQGYKIAISGFEFTARYFWILDVVDIIKMDFKDPHGTSLQNIVNIGKNFNKQVAAYNVNTQEAYDKAVELGCDYMQGSAIGQQSVSKVHRMDHIQSNFFQLIVAVTKD